MVCGLLGQHLSHSYSPQVHWLLGNYDYELFEKEPEELESFLGSGSFDGLNVTIPYKQAVLPYCGQLSEQARAVGAVNTILRLPDGTLLGHNTDYFGFASLLGNSGIDPAGKKALVLGSGGASKTVQAVLRHAGAHVVVVSRSGPDNYQNLSRHADAALLVNATPVGMFPQVDESPVDLTVFPHLEGVLDLIYNPARTSLMLQAQDRGIPAYGGLWMLVAQAKESSERFTGSAIPDSKIPEIVATIRRQQENIVLIGMPGSGKSVLGKMLSRETSRPVVDADDALEKRAGMTIPALFAEKGEAYFRNLEHAVLTELGKTSGQILSTGGGCVTRPENRNALRRNGLLFWIQRDAKKLSTRGRPLSKKGSMERMEQQRSPLYAQFADYTVDNNGSLEQTAAEILRLWEEAVIG